MTDEEYQRARPVINMAHRLHASLHDKLAERGVESIDILISSVEATVNLARNIHGGSAQGAIEWMRTALDLIERQMIEAYRSAH